MSSFFLLLLIIINILVSYKGLTNSLFFESYEFQVDRILVNRDYRRLITSGFLHVSWTHLIFNMLSLYIFSSPVQFGLGGISFLVIYFASLIGGSLFSLFIHRHHGDYSAVGASGAVCGVMFASVALFPDMSLGFFFIPIAIPAWIYTFLYVLISIYGIRSQKANIGHDAHLGGALIGMILALIMHPSALSENFGKIMLILVPTVIFIYFIITRPQILFVDNLFYKNHHDFYNIDHRYNAERSDQQQEVDRILDKISRRGMSSLSRQEKDTLKDYSKKLR
ncbi:MAG TPA: rhomboid family intramembrane serine protease [Puia sp.]|nr:rhomboid family intramembrane serine protease [Puia sp.]